MEHPRPRRTELYGGAKPCGVNSKNFKKRKAEDDEPHAESKSPSPPRKSVKRQKNGADPATVKSKPIKTPLSKLPGPQKNKKTAVLSGSTLGKNLKTARGNRKREGTPRPVASTRRRAIVGGDSSMKAPILENASSISSNNMNPKTSAEIDMVDIPDSDEETSKDETPVAARAALPDTNSFLDIEDTDSSSRVPESPQSNAFQRNVIPLTVHPWEESWAAPTSTFPDTTECPINWEYVQNHMKTLTKEQIHAYELRAPWKPHGEQRTWRELLAIVQTSAYSNVTSPEGVRKRFAKANTCVYMATGVYFENSVVGLEKFGIRIRKSVHKIKRARAAPKQTPQQTPKQTLRPPRLQTVGFILQPPNTLYDDRCIKCCDQGQCYDKGCRQDDCCSLCCETDFLCQGCRPSGDRRDDCCAKDCGEVICRCPCEHQGRAPEPNHTAVRWREFLAEKNAVFGCPEHQPLVTREVERAKMEAVSLRKIEDLNSPRVEPKAFDIFTNCFAPNNRLDVPSQLQYLDTRWAEDYIYHVYEDTGADYTVGDILKAYCCSQVLECPAVSDVILRQLMRIIEDEEALAAKYKSGAIELHDNLDVKLRVLDFEPEDVNYVFNHTLVDDPIRLLLLDIITYKGDYGSAQIKADEDRYHPVFLKYWKMREYDRKHTRLASLLQDHALLDVRRSFEEAGSFSNGTKLQLEEDLAYVREKLQEISRHIAALSAGPTEAPREDGLVGKIKFNSDWMDEEEEPGTIWGGCKFLGWLRPISVSDKDGVQVEDEQRFREAMTADTLVSKDEADFCNTYHNHNHGTEGYVCYRSQMNETPSSVEPNYVERPGRMHMHDVEVEIAGVKHTIQDHTLDRLGGITICSLVERYPEWDWPRIKSIDCYDHLYQTSHAAPGVFKTDRNARPNYYPKHVRDWENRYPSHPSYRVRASYLVKHVDQDDDDECEEEGEKII